MTDRNEIKAAHPPLPPSLLTSCSTNVCSTFRNNLYSSSFLAPNRPLTRRINARARRKSSFFRSRRERR